VEMELPQERGIYLNIFNLLIFSHIRDLFLFFVTYRLIIIEQISIELKMIVLGTNPKKGSCFSASKETIFIHEFMENFLKISTKSVDNY